MATADIEIQGIDLNRQSNFDEKVLPNEEEYATLRRIPDNLPKVALFILAVEVSLNSLPSRCTLATSTDPCSARREIHVLWSQWSDSELHQVRGSDPSDFCRRLTGVSNPYAPGSDLPGALGRGQAAATALGNFFKFWAYGSTVIGAIVADQYLGKFKAILVASSIYIIGLIIIVATSKPTAIQEGAGFGGLIAAMITIGLGTGGIKANVTPLCAEQYQNARPIVKTLNSG